MTIKKPLIVITLDSVDPQDEAGGDWYSDLPWYALRQRYCEAIAFAGGIPIPLPYQIEYVDDRKGHDFRYALNSSKIRQLTGWKPQHDYLQSLKTTVAWYQTWHERHGVIYS